MENFFDFIYNIFGKEEVLNSMDSVEDSVLNSGGMEDISYREFKEEVLCRLIESHFDFNGLAEIPDDDSRDNIMKYTEETSVKWSIAEEISKGVLEGGILCERDAIQEAINKETL